MLREASCFVMSADGSTAILSIILARQNVPPGSRGRIKTTQALHVLEERLPRHPRYETGWQLGDLLFTVEFGNLKRVDIDEAHAE